MAKNSAFDVEGGTRLGGEPDLAIRLFDALEVMTPDGAVPLPSRRAGWLLALLALRRGAPIERSVLAGMLWPDSTDAGALHNLRQTLAGVRRALGPAGELIRTISPRAILLEPGASLWVDAVEFDDALREGTIGALERAAVLYRGPLLSDCDEPFALREREPRERAFLDLADRLGATYAAAHDAVKAAEIYRRAIRVDPYRESATRGLMACLADSGEAATALDAYRTLARRLRRDLRTDPDPETKALCRSIRSKLGKPSPRPGGDPPDARPLPQPLTALIGRESEVEEIATLLDRCRLVTLVGVGGVGKTRLALAVAEAAEASYPDGLAFVDLAPVRDPRTVPSTIASAWGAPENAARPATEALCDGLRDRCALVVMDNCEHLIEGVAETLRSLLLSAPYLRVLATSRQPIGIAGEWVWRAPSLATPDPHASPEASLNSPSVRLFLERSASAGSVGPRPDEIGTVARICRRLDGIPLAIELAAARMSLLSVREIEERLDDRFAILGGEGRSVPRHQTLRAAMEWSWELLTDAERDLLGRLSVFRGGATLEAVEAVAGLPALDRLSRLVDRSLVVADLGPDGSRFSMLESVRQYVGERLEEAGGGEDARRRHAEFFCGWAAEVAKNLHRPGETPWFGRLERDHDNLRAALDRLHSRGQSEEELRLAVCLSRFWDTHGHLSEGRGLLERALRAAAPDLPPELVADAHGHAGWMATVQREPEAARRHYERALSYFRQVGDARRMAVNLNCLAAANGEAGDYASAEIQYAEALALYRELGLPGGIATVLANLGEMALYRGDPATARACLERSLVEGGGPDVGSPERRALTLSSLAVTDLRQGRPLEARDHAVRSLRLFSDAQAFVSLPQALGLMGIVEGVFGDWSRAARLLGAEQGLASSLGVPLFDLVEPERARTRADALQALGPDELGSALRWGCQMSRDEAAALALDGEKGIR